MPKKVADKKIRAFRSLTVTLSMAFLLLTLMILLITGGLETYISFKTQQKAISSQEQLIARGAADAVNGFIQEKFSILQTTARLGYTSSSSPREQEIALEKMLGLEQSFRQFVILDSRQQESLRVSRISKNLSNQLMELDKGEVFSQINKKETYISSIYIDKISSEPMAVIAVPIKNIFGDTEGALIAEVNLKFMWDMVDRLKVGTKGLVYVVDRRGNLIAFKDVSRVLKGENLAALKEVSEFIKNTGTSDQDPAAFSKGILGTNIVTTYAPLGTPDWAAVVELPVTEAYAAVIYQLEFTLVIIVLTIVFGAGFGIYLSRLITKPIISLRNAAEEISKGRLDTRAEIKSQDEIGQLALVFNKMAERLAAYTGELEKKVSERTRALNKKMEEISESNIALKEKQERIMSLVKDAQALQRSLMEERDRVKGVVACVGEGLIVTDQVGKITSINPAAGWKFELTEKEVVGKNIDTVIPLCLDKDCKTKILTEEYPTFKAIKQSKILISSLTDNYYYRGGSGKIMALAYSTSPLSKDGKVFGAVTIFRDITKEKQLDDAKNSFISIASHQLRTPLTSMRWFSEMLMSGDAGAINKDQTKFVERIYQGTERMIGLVNMLLQIARVEAGRIKIEPKMIDFKNTIRGVEITLKAQLKEKKQKLKLVFNPDPFPMIMMDQEVIWQVFHNLLSNASRYSPKKSTITIAIKKKDGFAEFSIIDKGAGIPDDAKNRIFDKFFRAENAIKLVPEGSGLGLSLVKSLVEGWGGRIWFESQKGKGSTFYFTVPFYGMKARQGEVSLAV
jgi:PAS domain S-box-containing protein